MNLHSAKATVQYKQVANDATYGTEVVTWRRLCDVHCEITDLLPSRSESVINGNLAVNKLQSRIRMRYRSNVDTTMRLVIKRGGVEYMYQLIAGPAEIGNGKYIEFVAERTTSDGY